MAGDRTKDAEAESNDDVIVDPDAALRACQVAAVRAKRWAEEQAQQAPVSPPVEAPQSPMVQNIDAKTYRQQERARLRAETARATAELAMLEAEDAAEAEREEQDRIVAAKLAEKQRLATEALEEERRRELDEIDQRLEARFGEVPTPPPPAVAAIDIAAAIEDSLAPAAASGLVPPPPPAPMRRRARVQVSASVLIDHFGTLVALPLVNISLTGALVSTVDIERPKMRVGQLLLMTLFASDDMKRQVDLVARVVRRTETEAALDWTGDANAMHGVAVLIDQLTS